MFLRRSSSAKRTQLSVTLWLAQVSMLMLFGERGWAQDFQDRRLQLTVQSGYLSEIPVLVRVDLLDSNGRSDREQWNAVVDLESDSSLVSFAPTRLTLRNGRGSVLVSVSGAEDFVLTATFDGMQAAKTLKFRGSEDAMSVSGALSGNETVWSGRVHVTENVLVPTGHTLTLAADTLVAIDGAASGTSAPGIAVNGRIQSLGTADQPVVITSAEPGKNWGQIRHDEAEASLYQFTHITKAGRAEGEGHTDTGPAIRSRSSDIRFEQSVISDLTEPGGRTIGKSMQSSRGSSIEFYDCLLARSRMGPEVSGTAILCADTFIMEMRGDDDDDAIYIHSQRVGQDAILTDCVIYGTDDDGIDTLGATITVSDCIIRDIFDKGVSVLSGECQLLRCLNVDCGIGVSTKTNDSGIVRTSIDQCTIIARNRGIAAENKNGGAPNATVLYSVANSIISATGTPANSIYTDYDPNVISIKYTNVPGEHWPGQGNLMDDPVFVDRSASDYRLALGSPCIDVGDPTASVDPDGSRRDMGAFAFQPPAPWLARSLYADGLFTFELHGYLNRSYIIEYTSDGVAWREVAQVDLATSPVVVEDPGAFESDQRFYRARLRISQ